MISHETLRYVDIDSQDGTRIRAWTNDVDGPPVLLSNGLGTNPFAWPGLLREDCGVRVVSWNHRGTGGGGRVAQRRVNLDAFVEDAVATLDAFGLERAPVLAWSAGVTVAFELARRFPERVEGIYAIAGVPGDTFSTTLAPLRVPPFIARRMVVALSHTARRFGPLVEPLTRGLPVVPLASRVLRTTRLIDPAADLEELQALLHEFRTTHPRWYAHLALSVKDHQRISLSSIDYPVRFLAGRRDLLVGARYVKTAADRIAHAAYDEINATHFIGVEFPDYVTESLHAFLADLAPGTR